MIDMGTKLEIMRFVRSPEFSSLVPSQSVSGRRVDLPHVTALPAAPKHGDQVLLVVNRTDGPYWHLRYDGELAPPYQWHVMGEQVAVYAEDDDQGTTNSISYTDLTSSSVGPTIVLPQPGIYNVTCECLVANDTANQSNAMSFQVGATAAVDADMAYSGTTTNLVTVKAIDTARRKVIPAGSLTLTAKYRVTGSNGYFEMRRLSARPVLLGRA